MRKQLHCWVGPTFMGRIHARLCAGTQPSRAHLGLLEAARATQCLPETLLGLDQTARRTLKRMRRRPRLITAFWQQAELSFWCLYIMRTSIIRPNRSYVKY